MCPIHKSITHTNDDYVDNTENLDIIMLMYNLIEYGNNYSETSGSLWQFKRNEFYINNAENPANVTTVNWASFKYKSSFYKTLTDTDNGVFKNVKIVVPLKYLSNFWRSLEIPLINCKSHLELNWTKNCVMSNIAGNTRFKITNTRFYILIVALSTKDNVNLAK